MNVLIVGGGGREHAIVWALSKSEQVEQLYCAPGNGSYWSLIYQGGEDLGLDVWEIDKGYASVKEELEGGHVIICLVGPGAFTTDGHFIVIAGMDSDGKLIINDSNSRTRSEKTWDYYEIYDQIDTMWTLCGHDYVG